ncbi:hypothetical protein [Citricoccus sp. GCM10030269]|uniref:hypothetical protein n=1 Tax=Citricoccus sp. GCM10030269 TaxID=3273388 RepID=UPI00361BE930
MPGDSQNNDLLRPQSPEVYRRRRIVALVLLIVVLAIIAGLIWWVASLFRPSADDAPTTAPTSSTEQASGSATASASPSPANSESDDNASTGGASDEASPSASPSESGASESGDAASASADASGATECQPDDLAVSAGTDQESYGEGEEPVLELRVENTGDEPCEANLGTSQQVFTVYSGSDRIFSTQDCQVESEDAMVEIAPDQPETARFTWPRVRSAPECADVSSEPGGGTYRLEVSLGELEAEPVSFRLT